MWGKRLSGVLLSLGLGAVTLAQAAESVLANPLEAVYSRATNQFAAATFFKPAEPKVADLSFSLAPMLLQEVKADPPRCPQFGMLVHSNGVLTVDASRPAIYVAADSLRRKEKTYARLSYVWVYADFRLQGVRLTLDGSGQPCIWETLADRSGAALFFVSQRLEAAARAEFGKPLPGRRYAIERGWSESPKAVVARVLEDAPAVMGPMVYLQAGTSDVSTLICRCMPAQVKQLVHTGTYALVAVSGTAEGLLNEAKVLSGMQPAFWPGDPETERLEQHLRLPGAF